MKAKYCKCRNTYTNKCTPRSCTLNVPDYWFHGIGRISAIPDFNLLTEEGGFLLTEAGEEILYR